MRPAVPTVGDAAPQRGYRKGNNRRGRRFTRTTSCPEAIIATTVGTENDIRDLVRNLILLEHDAIAAYESTIERLSDAALSQKVEEFRQDHLHHLGVLRDIASETGAEAPQEGDMKQWLTTGKIALADLFGDTAILKAMATNENDTVTAYERASAHPDAIEKSRAFFRNALADEQRHREWMQRTADAL